MKTFIFLFLLLQNLPTVSVQPTEFSSTIEWVNNENTLLEKLGKSENRDLTMKIIQRTIIGDNPVLLLAVPVDKTGNNGFTTYRNEPIGVLIVNRKLYIISNPGRF